MNHRLVILALLTSAASVVLLPPIRAAAVEPLLVWAGAAPPGTVAGETIDVAKASLPGGGTVAGLQPLRFLPPNEPRRADACRPLWIQGDGGGLAVALGPAIARSIWAPAQRSAVVQCGAVLPQPLQLNGVTLVLQFRLTGDMCRGGGTPPWELDGILMDLPPSVSLRLQGAGPTGRNPRVPVLVVNGSDGQDTRFAADPSAAVTSGEWHTLMVSWTAAVAADSAPAPVRLWLDDAEVGMKPVAGPGNPSGALPLVGPVRIGGDCNWLDVPMDLAGFAVFDRAMGPDDAMQALRGQSYDLRREANRTEAWTVTGPGVELTDEAGGVLSLKFGDTAPGGTVRLALKEPVPVEGAAALNFWYCMPAVAPGDFGHEIQALFCTATGEEHAVKAARCVSTHIAPGNSRKAGLWMYVMADVPKGKSVTAFTGFSVNTEVYGKVFTPHAVFLRDLGVDRIDYGRVSLYYVVGNFRDNFAMVAFNGSGARAMTDASGGARRPFVNLDNLLDQAKDGRPPVVDLHVQAFDQEDRLVYERWLTGLNTANTADFLQRIELPITAPGTYRIKGKSYDATTKAFFTTDWVQLIVVRGNGSLPGEPAHRAAGLLSINPGKPFGRLEKNAPCEIEFIVAPRPDTALSESLELRYAVVPNVVWVPGRATCRDVTLDQTLSVAGPGSLKVPYAPQHCVERVVAELWSGTTRLDREERLIGIRNGLDAAPALTAPIPSFAELTAPHGIWMNSQFHALVDRCGDKVLDVVAQNLDEVKKITPNVGMMPELHRLEPMPGVYDWDYLQALFDLAAQHGCRFVLYLSQKWPPDWAPVEFYEDERGRIHGTGIVWRHMVGGYNYATGEHGPDIIREFNCQLARRFLNHPGFGAYYFENEHIVSDGSTSLPTSRDPANRARFAAFLREKYGDIDALNRGYGTTYSSFAEVRIPDGNPVRFPRRAMHADLPQYVMRAAEDFILRNQFDAVRAEDPRRPIIVYSIGMSHPASVGFYRHIAENGGIMANGGVHSTFDHTTFRDAYQAVPGLIERMEPHDMWNYEPCTFGFDDMLYGMLADGGRGIAFHYFLDVGPGRPFNYDTYKAPAKNGLYRILEKWESLCELRQTERLHDAVGIMDLRKAYSYFLSYWTPGVRPYMASIYVFNHYAPSIYQPGMDLAHLDGSQVLFLTGEIIDTAELEYVRRHLAAGKTVVLDSTAASFSFADPDRPSRHCLLESLGLDPLAAGEQLPGVSFPHDVLGVGKGRVLILRTPLGGEPWGGIVPAIMAWAGVTERLADSDDKFMQMHTLQAGDVYYLVTAHRGFDPNGYDGPKEWEGNVRFLKPLPEGNYRVSEIWVDRDREVGVFTPAALATEFSAGKYAELQMKVFRIAPVR